MTPNFRREIRVGAFLFLALFTALCSSLEDASGDPPICLVPDPSNEGPSRVMKEDVVVSDFLMV